MDARVFGHVGSLILVGPSNHSFLTYSLPLFHFLRDARRFFPQFLLARNENKHALRASADISDRENGRGQEFGSISSLEKSSFARKMVGVLTTM